MIIPIQDLTGEPLVDISLDTLKKNKQLIIFVNTKKSAEATAEKISHKLQKDTKTTNQELEEISEQLEKTLPNPTKQCQRLAKTAKTGTAFHHSGLHQKQREIIEENFREGKIKIICATPTLAAGVDLPAFRVIIRDLKRYGGSFGMTDIPVLEYEQQAGRAGRPKFDTSGQAICISENTAEKEYLWNKYINGEPEEILSKLAVEPVLRTYILSLVSTGYVNSMASLKEFMNQTFYAHQYKDLTKLSNIIEKMIDLLEEWEFITKEQTEQENKNTQNTQKPHEKQQKPNEFISASEIKNKKNATQEKTKETKLKATRLGQRVAELYLDPYTAHYLLECLQRAAASEPNEFSILQMISWTLEMRPLIRARKKDYEAIDEKIVEQESKLITLEPDPYTDEHDEYTDSIKTAITLEAWMNETTEEKILEELNVTPGELNAKLERGEWLLHSADELSKLQGFRETSKLITKTRMRLSQGVKEELLTLLKLKNIGRIRARRLFNNGIKDLGDVKKADITTLSQILGKKIAVDIKKQVGQEFSEEKIQVKTNKRKGQISLHDF